METNHTMTKQTNITGRDHSTICKALAYAIVAIERLPDEWQEWSDKEDMGKLLEARCPDEYTRNHYITVARSHLERRGVAIEDGKMVVAPRDPVTVVVPFEAQ
jgi:hypothetical protein